MIRVMLATVEDGALKPDQDIGLSSGTKVRITLEPCDRVSFAASRACGVLDALCGAFPVESQGGD